MDNLRIFPRHARSCGYCLVPGVKSWLEAHGLSWQTFIREGLPVEDILLTGDAMGHNVVQAAIREQENGR